MPKISPPVLLGERIQLRRLEERDAPALLEMYSDPEVMRFWSHAPWTTLAQAEAAITEAHNDYAEGSSLHLVIEHRETAALVGSCALYGVIPQSRRATIGYLLSRRHWGHGYLKEALRAMLDYGMAELDLNRIEAEVDPRNTASVKALEGLGFQREGILRERWIVRGETFDIALYALLRSEWVFTKY